MQSQKLTFPCPFCGRRMGVGVALLGKRVRCPHCKQVSVAPSAAEPPATNPSTPRPSEKRVVVGPAVFPPPPPETPSIPKLPESPNEVNEFIFQKKEAADSILSDPEESEDDLFGSRSGARVPAIEMPDIPHDTTPFHPPVIVTPVPAATDPADPWTELDATAASQPVSTIPTPAARDEEMEPAAIASGIPPALFYGLAAYALVMTLLAVYGLFFK